MRGVALEEIATATKISSRFLRALEQEKFDQLPGGVFNKGFVRAYAKFLGIDEEQAVADYQTAYQASVGPVEPPEAQDKKLTETLERWQKSESDDLSTLRRRSGLSSMAVIVVIAA